MRRICRAKPLTSIFLALILAFTSQLPAFSDTKILDLFSDYDSYNPTGIDYNYDLQRVEVGLYASDPDRLVVWLHFRNPITRSMFTNSANGGGSPWALVSMWRNKPSSMGGNLQDFRLSTNGNQSYPSDNTSITATASGNTISGGSRSDLSSCKPTTWSNIVEGAKWIGFGISRSCAKIPDSFYIAGYVDPNTNNGDYSDYDYAPDSAFFVDLNSGILPSASPSPTRSTASTRKSLQTISVDKPLDVTTEDSYGEVYAYSSSGLPLRFESRSPSTCDYSYSEESTAYFEIYREGLCLVAIYQDGDDYFLAAPTQYTSFMIQLILSSPSPKQSPAKKSTPTPTPTKKITGTVSTTKQVSVPTTKATTSSKIGGSASSQKKPSPTPTPSKKK